MKLLRTRDRKLCYTGLVRLLEAESVQSSSPGWWGPIVTGQRNGDIRLCEQATRDSAREVKKAIFWMKIWQVGDTGHDHFIYAIDVSNETTTK